MFLPALLASFLACQPAPGEPDTGGDGGTSDGGTSDGGTSDGGTSDGGASDGGTSDGGTSDGGTDDSACAPAEPLVGFVWRDGAQLHDDDGVFRFASVNIPNLHIVEDGGWHLPTEWEQRDALCAVRQIGGRVARTYVLSVGESGVELPRHVTAPGVLEEELMVAFDQALAIANEQGIRLIVPLVDQWTWWGGIEDYAAFRGLRANAFWNNEQVIADFEATITALLTRTNTITGVRYSADPAILAWETGNELDAPTEWTLRIAAHIRSLDDNHLVIDGHYGIDEGVLDSDDIDIVSNHYYWPWPYGDDNAAALRADMALLDGRRPFLLGEFGLLSTDRMLETLDEAVAQPDVVGALIWSLRFHADPGGFYWHSEGLIGEVEHRSFRWPGFGSGDAYGERDVLAGLREAAWAMQEQPPPDLPAPDPPEILAVDSAGTVTWRGATGAASYVLERADSKEGPWTVVAEDFDDAQQELVAEVTDPTLSPEDPASGQAWYRMAAVNDAGVSAPSAAWGPVDVDVGRR